MPLEIIWSRVSHELRFKPGDREPTKVLRAELVIGPHRFVEEVPDGPDAMAELGRRAELLRFNLEQLPK